eukprot:CAMPEP_0171323200 /NCGR_PEP_ID=MMETSP0816-20121228/115430_1 /TAXON_ID=420281 /ORGANISM="Proboscia inermis, Strain CCAP1064/1" /LENGTH=232 /DNA_ID=CAMNT_0011821857 /DNA_START=572 /DNA_END=1270 /DNA_ORIENTATION=-
MAEVLQTGHSARTLKTPPLVSSAILYTLILSNGGCLANGTFRAALQQPRIDAVHLKGMQAGYCSYGITGLVRFQTDGTALGRCRYGGCGRCIGGMVVGGDGRALSSSCFPIAGGTHRAPNRIILPPTTPQQIILLPHNGLGTPFNLLPAHGIQPSLIGPTRLLIVPQQPLVIIPIEITIGEHQPQRVSGYWRFAVVHPGGIEGGHQTLQCAGIGVIGIGVVAAQVEDAMEGR